MIMCISHKALSPILSPLKDNHIYVGGVRVGTYQTEIVMERSIYSNRAVRHFYNDSQLF